MEEGIYFDGHDRTISEIIECLDKKIQYIEQELYSNIAALYEKIEQLRPELDAQTERSEQKFDLEIFEVIEASNPFLQNLK